MREADDGLPSGSSGTGEGPDRAGRRRHRHHVMTLLRFTGLVDDRPWRQKLWRWWLYAGNGCLNLVLLIVALIGAGVDDRARTRVVALVALLPVALAMLVLAVIARRHQRRDQSPRPGSGAPPRNAS